MPFKTGNNFKTPEAMAISGECLDKLVTVIQNKKLPNIEAMGNGNTKDPEKKATLVLCHGICKHHYPEIEGSKKRRYLLEEAFKRWHQSKRFLI
jgi:hypothetical protein